MTALKLGEDNALSLGIDVKKLRYKSFLIISIITGVAISFVGTIGFIGWSSLILPDWLLEMTSATICRHLDFLALLFCRELH